MIYAAFAVLLIAVVVLFAMHHRLREKVYELRHNRRELGNALLANIRLATQNQIRARMAARGVKEGLPVEFRAQQGEDLLLWAIFEDQPTGTYLECGAFDGERYSLTYIFEAAGWKGVLVEALPDLYANCVAKRPGSTVINAACSRKGSKGTAEFLALDQGDIGFSTSRLSESPLSGVKSMKKAAKVTVPLMTMDDALKDWNGKIDFAVLDVEGSELDLLDGFDLDRFGVRALVIEDHSYGSDSALRTHMRGRGYEFVSRVGRNDLYVTKKDPALLARARQLSMLK
jgi:FkbM family methyltransferase